ncbi:Nse4 C-terminal-domain-containing protein [Yarrowia lipolytica]|uniref:Non-structural maintenance of chromosomes element 4 n=1 Tax=Yarrowia lipolytica TaxID=4952 RepID=A0A1D8N4K9_YARLL|nr:hypothetical protein YALI1_A12989g [Yarrowia lipolytica]KAJ8051626.1 Nse4 C-terminal-domain-containing protein [Yarrowia lipolytica]VBB89700.1 Nsmce4a protein, putative [Yarrowia lipolytica]
MTDEDEYSRQQELQADYDEFEKDVENADGELVLGIIERANQVKQKYKDDRRALVKDADLLKTVATKKTKHIKKYALAQPGTIDLKQVQNMVTRFLDAAAEAEDPAFDRVVDAFTGLSADPQAVPDFKRIAALGRVGMKYGRVARGASHLIGALEKDRPQKVRQMKPREMPTETGAQEQAKQLKGNEIDTTKNNIQRFGGIMRRRLTDEYNYRKKQGEPLPMLQAIIDPRSFEFTVQNFFVFSTLVAGGMAKLSEYEDSTPVIEMCSDEETAQLVNDRDSRCPVVLEMDYETYEMILDAYEMRDQEPLLDLGDTTMGLSAE